MRDVAVAWIQSPYGGLFRDGGFLELRAHDPAVPIWAGTPANRPAGADPGVGGAGWTAADAELAGVGECIERWSTHPLAVDGMIEARYHDWPLAEPAIDPARWVLFSEEQYVLPAFPFEPLRRDTTCPWVCFRRAGTGAPAWVPAELAFLDARAGAHHRFGPAISTGWSAHASPAVALLRGVQEVIERDAVMGAWWGVYPLVRCDVRRVLEELPRAVERAIVRGNLDWSFYHVISPFSAHVTLASVVGEDREGLAFSIGSACRDTRAESWAKAILEAVQGRRYVRWLRRQVADGAMAPGSVPRDFRAHAVWYSLHPDVLARTVLATGRAAPSEDSDAALREDLPALARRLGEEHPILFRLVTPPAIARAAREWVVVRVMIPGLQPMHADHLLPYLGGLFRPRSWRDWLETPPHPFA